MNNTERQSIHSLFENKNYLELYQLKKETINEMLLIESQSEFDDFLEDEDCLDENLFWLYDSAVEGNSLLIGGYEEDVTEKVTEFFKQKLPAPIFDLIKADLHDLYVDLGTRDTLDSKIKTCNQNLVGTDYLIKIHYDDTFCDGVYFLSIQSVE